MSRATTESSRSPVRSKPWPAWPISGARERELLDRALEEGHWSGADAPLKAEFEARWAGYTQSRHVTAVTNGTVSLEIALRSLGVGAGDEVIVPPYTFLATASAVLQISALPVFADIDPETYNIDPAAVADAVTPRTRAVIAVHLGGQPADLDALAELCDRRGLALIEDAAHAHGAQWRGRPAGTFGSFGSWSFQASKNLSAGEGGALTTNDDALASAAYTLHNCGRLRGGPWYEHHQLGGNYRLTEWQCAVLLAGLERLPEQVANRERCARVLDAELARIPGIRPLARDARTTVHAHHLYLFRYSSEAFHGLDLEGFVAALNRQGIPALRGYPTPLNRQPVLRDAAFDHRATGWSPNTPHTRYDAVELPVCERACLETVWLPHRMLLAPAEEMADVVEAVEVVRRESAG